MKELNVYVEELLFKYQCVIIPKFGAFISNRKSAKLFEDKTFTPPKREITFNSSLVSNDGLLIKHISESSGVSYEQAESFISDVVETWKERLNKKEIISLGNIGFIKQTPEGRISFEASDSVNFLTDSFGMSTFVPHEVAPNVKFDPTPKSKEETPEKVPFEPVTVSNSSAATEVKQEQTANEEEKQEKKGSLLKYVAIAVIGVGLLGFGAYSYLQANKQAPEIVIQEADVQKELQLKISEATFFNSTPIVLPPVSLNVSKVAETQKTAETQKDKPKATETNVSASKKPETSKKETTQNSTEKTSKTTVSKKYQVIAGAFKDEKNAKSRVNQLKAMGYANASIIGKNKKGLYQVSYSGFDNIEQANALKKKIKDQNNLDAWVLINE
ncbi:putative Conserved N-acetylmuramoyl-L-alanine amidase [Capnocytophaga canimorsus]|uniref:Putative Conserved N-acetylmuramoyl-L-alanine amidase n=1 Tax=Capnocytophaga canimorsus TaxID=28188 RepID=A0A0B7HKS5_9FLAO|nr:SPOR domain-containing protein [Capnocytophaga canimorsus]ATA77330.1 SPOR domain-containing protein [Capnocytophaga canimorsus]PJI83505.1 sporulation related protein [Capnocytophaga canimorsus]CEN38123.1 putative Conserved N-acetylmuramoyl-L-alanine amidase [Capnocytophaga canimorsus]STA72572.1 Sporulation related domain [Capnocytophaga canimorsus]